MLESKSVEQAAFTIEESEEQKLSSEHPVNNVGKLNAPDDDSQLSSEVANDEDNDIFDIDLKYEILKSGEFENMPDPNINENTESESGCDNIQEHLCTENNQTTVGKDLTNTHIENEANYSQSAPNLTLYDWMNSNKCKGKELKVETNLVIENTDLTINEYNSDQDVNVSDVAAESMIWLAHRLGPVLSAKYLTRNLLRMLTLCYDSSEKRELVYLSPGSKEAKMISISCMWLKGDMNAFKVLDCLSRIATLYGEQFIMIQYVKHIADLLHLCRRKVPASLESGLLGAMALLQFIIPYVSDSTLMDHLQDIFLKDILHLVLRLTSSLRIVFPGAAKSRMMVTFRILDVMYTIGLRIGFEMTRKHLSSSLQKFFSCFDKVYDEHGNYKEFCECEESTPGINPVKEQAFIEMKQTFTPEMAFLAYIPFCKLAGGIHMERTLKNDELIRNLCVRHDESIALSKAECKTSEGFATHVIPSEASHKRNISLGQEESFVSGVFGKNVNVVGNRLDVHLGDDSHLVMSMGEPVTPLSLNNSFTSSVPKYEINFIKKKMDNCQRHLKGNWFSYWEHEIGRNEKDCYFDFKQIKLQTFIGHTGAVRAIEVLDNENSFLTSSKDKTVKLWSLRSCGDGSSVVPCQWTYTQHRKSVFAVSFLNSLRLVGSCDGSVHIWDPFLGSCIKQIEPSKGSPVTVLEALPAPSATFLAATTNSTVRFLDARTCKYMHEFKVNVGTTGLIRSLAVSPDGHRIAVGHSTGILSILDLRTGMVIGTWLGHEGEILQLKAVNNSCFITSSLDHALTVWEFEDTQAKCNLKGPVEPVTSICFYGNEVISGTTGNRIGLHSSTDKNAVYTSTRLRSDTFKGILTTMALLPLNRLLLLGTDNGSTVLLA